MRSHKLGSDHSTESEKKKKETNLLEICVLFLEAFGSSKFT
jgi:hypothetical protein